MTLGFPGSPERLLGVLKAILFSLFQWGESGEMTGFSRMANRPAQGLLFWKNDSWFSAGLVSSYAGLVSGHVRKVEVGRKNK